MKQYIGTKMIQAEPAAKDGSDGYKVLYPDGYESWSPKDVFEAAYRPTDGVNFGLALEAMKQGKGARLPHWKPDVVIRVLRPSVNLERVAEAVHNAWWEEKKRQGVEEHPDMRPYDELSESVKEYDRVTAKAVIESMDYMTAPFLYVENRFGRVPWKETMIELFSDNWEVVE